jgi:hypothetical protein
LVTQEGDEHAMIDTYPSLFAGDLPIVVVGAVMKRATNSEFLKVALY